jgi:hypothetical protein
MDTFYILLAVAGSVVMTSKVAERVYFHHRLRLLQRRLLDRSFSAGELLNIRLSLSILRSQAKDFPGAIRRCDELEQRLANRACSGKTVTEEAGVQTDFRKS